MPSLSEQERHEQLEREADAWLAEDRKATREHHNILSPHQLEHRRRKEQFVESGVVEYGAPVEEDTLSQMIEAEDAKWIRSAMSALPDELREIVELTFGFNDKDEHNLREVAELVGIAKTGVHERLVKAEAIIREFERSGEFLP